MRTEVRNGQQSAITPFRSSLPGALLSVLLILSGCVTPPPLSSDEPAYPTGTVLRLERPVTIPARRSGAWLGRGPLIINPGREEIVCRLEINTPQDEDLVIAPDHFTVRGVARDRERFVGWEPTLVAVSRVPFPGLDSESGWTLVNTYIYLELRHQPEVQRLKCQQARDDFGLGVLTPQDLAPVLAETITVLR
jgi:hypothetical protein